MLSKKAVNIFLIFTIFYGCGPSTFFYKKGKYASTDAAFRAQRNDIKKMLSEIGPTQNPLGGKALVVLPSRKLIEKEMIYFMPNPKSQWIEYPVSTAENTIDAMAGTLPKRKIFEEVSIIKNDKPESVTLYNEYSIIIYLLVTGPDQFQWYLKTFSSDEPVPIYFNQSFAINSSQRALSWLDYIEKTAAVKRSDGR
jgi:hypothetical protein